MNSVAQFLTNYILQCLVMAVLISGVILTTNASHAKEQEFTGLNKSGEISASSGPAVAHAGESVKRNYTTAARNFAEQNEHAVSSAKAQPKTIRIILGVVLTGFVIFLFVNLMAVGNNARYCSTCGYTGSMKAVKFMERPFFNALFMILVNVLPVLLYYFSEHGRFICPKCNRTSTNVTMKSRLKVI